MPEPITIPDPTKGDPNATPPSTPEPSLSAEESAKFDKELSESMERVFRSSAKAPEKAKGEGTETPPKQDEKAVEPTKPDAQKKDEAADTLETGEKIPPNAGPKWYREQIKAANAAKKAVEAKLAEWQSKAAEAEARAKDMPTVTERLAAAEKARDEALATARAVKQELSPEFKDKYVRPFERAAETARKEVSQLRVVDEDGQPVRAVDWEKDFGRLFNLDRFEAKQEAKKLFGDDAALVMEHYTHLHRLRDEHDNALAAEKANWEQRTKDDETRRIKQQQAYKDVVARVDKDVGEKFEFLKDDPNDPEFNKLLKEERELFAAKPDNFTQDVLLRSMRRQFAAAARPLAHRVTKLLAENAELKATIEKMKGNAPGPGKRPEAATEKAPYKSIAQELREAMKD